MTRVGVGVVSGVGTWVWRELDLHWALVARDLPASVVPASLFAVSAHLVGGGSAGGIPAVLARAALYFSLYILTFCLANQIAGVEEDRVNKPDRPIPSGRLGLSEAYLRWAIANVAFWAVAWGLGGTELLLWALGWQLLTVAYNFGGLHRHWLPKNLVFIGGGAVLQLAPAWSIGGALTPDAWRYLVVVSLSFAATLHLQDLRDVDGDRAIGRVTLPIAVGMWPARVLTAGSIAALPVVVGVFLADAVGWEALGAQIALGVLNAVVVWRILTLEGSRVDHVTYQLHCFWFCGVLGAASVLLVA